MFTTAQLVYRPAVGAGFFAVNECHACEKKLTITNKIQEINQLRRCPAEEDLNEPEALRSVGEFVLGGMNPWNEPVE